MKRFAIDKQQGSFRVLTNGASSQAAVMTLEPGESTGLPDNEHPKSEQWLYVISGIGRALVDKHRVSLRENLLLLIEKNEIHQIKNTGKKPLVTLNFYAPSAYEKDGEE